MIFGTMTNKLAALSFALTALTASGTALAQDQEPAVLVHFYDLDLTSQSDVERLDGRLQRAVRSVCGGSTERSLKTAALQHECRAAAWTNLEPQRSSAIARATGGQGSETLVAQAGGSSIRVAGGN